MTNADIQTVLPEVLLAAYAMLALMFGVYTTKDKVAPLLVWVTSAVLAVLGLWILTGGGGDVAAFGGMIVNDAFARFAKVVILFSAAAVLLMSEGYMAKRGLLRFEYPLLVALAVVGMMVMVSAGDLMALYMGLELQSLALYVVAALRRDSVKSTEAGLKYFVLGALSSGLLLYGASLVYGFAGTTLFTGIIAAVGEGQAPLGLLFGLVFVIAGMAFKVSAAPFHMWTPDVYEGVPTPVTAFFAVAPKIAALALLLRVLIGPFGDLLVHWQQIVIVISVLSMALGALAAINQKNIKRLMAYSSIGHVGYALVGLAAGTESGVHGVLVYLAIYLVMNIGTFACILCMRRGGVMVEGINDLAGLGKTHPLLAATIAIFMFSLAGIPPLAGFFGKLYVFVAAIDAGLYILAIIGVVTSVVGAFYYLRIIKVMYFDDPIDALDSNIGREMTFVIGVTSVIVILFFVYPSPVLNTAKIAAAALLAG